MIYIGADHRGEFLKHIIMDYFFEEKYDDVIDIDDPDADENDDFNGYAIGVAQCAVTDPDGVGILICGSGLGMTIQANRVKGARAINGTSAELVRIGREHLDANVLCLGADYLDPDTAIEFVKIFLDENLFFDQDDNHERRIKKLDEEIQEVEILNA